MSRTKGKATDRWTDGTAGGNAVFQFSKGRHSRPVHVPDLVRRKLDAASGVGVQLTTNYYWSSSECSSNNARNVNLNNGNVNNNNKNNNNRVRAFLRVGA